MKNIIHSNRLYLILCAIFLLVCRTLEATAKHRNFENDFDEYESKQDIEDEYNAESDTEYSTRNNQQEKRPNRLTNQESKFFVKRKNELMIPANGDCLFTSVLLGYLLPVLENKNDFAKRCILLLGNKEVEKNVDHLLQTLKKISWDNYLDLIQTSFLKQIIKLFRANVGIQDKLWGGPKEMEILCEKLRVSIQEYVPNPATNNEELAEPKTIQPKKGQIVETIGIIQDVASSKEKSYDQSDSLEYHFMVNQSIQEQVHSQHFRLKIDNRIIAQLKRKEKDDQVLTTSSQREMFYAYMKELQNINFSAVTPNDQQFKAINFFIPDNQKSPEIPDSLEKDLITLVEELKRLADIQPSSSVIHNNQAAKPKIQSSSSGGKDDEDPPAKMVVLCDKIEKNDKKYIKESALKRKLNLEIQQIRTDINLGNFLAAFKKAEVLLKTVQPLSIRDTLYYARKAEKASNFIAGKHIILFIGMTDVGKSTTLLYLVGCKMKTVIQENVTHIKADKGSIPRKYQKRIKDITSSALPRSETHYITGVPLDTQDFLDDDDDDDDPLLEEIVLCDTPGFEDTNGAEIDIANGTGVIRAIKKAKGVRIALLLSVASLTEKRMQAVTNLVHLIAKMIPDFDGNKPFFTYLFTKATKKETQKEKEKETQTQNEKIQNEIHARFDNLLNTEKKGEIKLDEATKSILKDIRKKIKSKPKRKLPKQAFIVDPTKSIPGTASHKEILKSLINSKHYIKDPTQVFTSYVTEKSKNTLTTQLRYHEYAIEKALESKQFRLATYKLDEVSKMKNLLNNNNINSTYRDICNKAKSQWDNIAETNIQMIEKWFLSSKKLHNNKVIIDNYIRTYRLYASFDNALRKNHFPDQNSFASESFIIKLKEILVKNRINILQYLFSDSEKAKTYLSKLKDISKAIRCYTPFLEKTYELLSKEVTKKEEEFSRFILKKQFNEAGDILNCIKKAQTLESELNTNTLSLKKSYNRMKYDLLDPLENALKSTYQILGAEYKKENSKDQQIKLSEQGTQLPKLKKRSGRYRLARFNLNKVNQLRNQYQIIQKAAHAFRNKQELRDITQEINKIYQDYINQNIAFIKEATHHIIQLVKINQEGDVEKANKLTSCIQELREVAVEISNNTSNEDDQILEVMTSQLQKNEKGIKSLIKQMLTKQDDKKEIANKLANYISNVKSSDLLDKQQKKYRLKELEDSLVATLKKSYRKVQLSDLGLNDPESLKEVARFMNILDIISESQAGDHFKKVANCQKPFLKEINIKVISTISYIEENFDERKMNIHSQQKLLSQLNAYKKYFTEHQESEHTFKQELKKLPKQIVDEETLEKAISSLTKSISKRKKEFREYNKEYLEKIKDNEEELAYLEDLVRFSNNYQLKKDENTKPLTKALAIETNGKFQTIEEIIKLKKEKTRFKETLVNEIKQKEVKEKKIVEEIKKQRKEYNDIIKDYKEGQEITINHIEGSIEAISSSFLPSDKVQNLINGQVDWLDDYIENLQSKINICKNQIKKGNSLVGGLNVNEVFKSLKYLKEAILVDWFEQNDHDYYSMENILERDLNHLRSYLRNYVKMVKENMEAALNDLARQYDEISSDDEHENKNEFKSNIRRLDHSQVQGTNEHKNNNEGKSYSKSKDRNQPNNNNKHIDHHERKRSSKRKQDRNQPNYDNKVKYDKKHNSSNKSKYNDDTSDDDTSDDDTSDDDEVKDNKKHNNSNKSKYNDDTSDDDEVKDDRKHNSSNKSKYDDDTSDDDEVKDDRKHNSSNKSKYDNTSDDEVKNDQEYNSSNKAEYDDDAKDDQEHKYYNHHHDKVTHKVQLKAAKKFYKLFKEVDSWRISYKEKLFDRYVTIGFITNCKGRMDEIVEQLEEKYSRIFEKDNLKEIINESKIVKIISKLDPWLDKEEKRATKLYKKYETIINEGISDKKILERIEKREYSILNQELKNVLNRSRTINNSKYNMKKVIKSIQRALANSIIKLIEEVDRLFLHSIQLNSKQDLNDIEVQKMSTLVKKLTTAQSCFFKDKNSFLVDYQSELEEKYTLLKEKVSNWMQARNQQLDHNIKQNQFSKAERDVKMLSKMQLALAQTPFLDSKAMQRNLDQEIRDQVSSLKKKYSIDPLTNSFNPLHGLASVYEQLKNTEREKEAEEILQKVENKYRVYLNNISTDDSAISIERQEQELQVARDMLSAMPKDLNKKLETQYNKKSHDFEIKKNEINKQLIEVQSSNNAEKHIEVWNKYSKGKYSTQRVREKIREKIKVQSQKISKEFHNLLQKKQLNNAHQVLKELEKYKEGLDINDFPKLYKIYYQAQEKLLDYGNQLLAHIDSKPSKIEQNPKKLHTIVTHFKQFKEYNKLFLVKKQQ